MTEGSRGSEYQNVSSTRRDDSSSDALNVSRSKTPCWTCRRRRVQCDGALPTCLKCHKAGKECLGYKKPLVWNKGVASRGKMMGKTYKAPVKPSESSSDDSKSSPNEVESSDDVSSTPSVVITSSRQTDDWEEPNGVVALVPRVEPTVGNMLVDPIFQDLKPITRYYLDYFCHKLCPEAVLHDLPGHNPFRDLIATVGYSPLLLKSMLGAAARHATNYASSPASFPATLATPSESSAPLQLDHSSARYHAYWYKQVALIQLRKDLEQSKGSSIENDVFVASISLLIWIDLLEAGKNTWRIHLEGMKKVIGLEDTKQPTAKRSRSITQSSLDITAHPYFFDICVIFDIMGTTLSRPYKINKPLRPSATVKNSLFRAEKISFIGCPAELLHIILIINWKCWVRNQSSMSAANVRASSPSSTHFADVEALKNDEYEEYTNEIILERILNFDCQTWARKTTLFAPDSDTEERVHVGFAYQYAILIYYHRVLDPFLAYRSTNLFEPTDNPTTLLSLAHSTLTHLVQIPPDHPFVKTIVWPTFIAGAELLSSPGTTATSSSSPAAPNLPSPPPSTTSPSLTSSTSTSGIDYRELTRNLLYTFWNMYHSANVINATKVLEEIWKKTDAIIDSMTPEEHEEHEKSGVWSRGVLNCSEAESLSDDAAGENGEKAKVGRWKDFWVDGDVDWLFV